MDARAITVRPRRSRRPTSRATIARRTTMRKVPGSAPTASGLCAPLASCFANAAPFGATGRGASNRCTSPRGHQPARESRRAPAQWTQNGGTTPYEQPRLYDAAAAGSPGERVPYAAAPPASRTPERSVARNQQSSRRTRMEAYASRTSAHRSECRLAQEEGLGGLSIRRLKRMRFPRSGPKGSRPRRHAPKLSRDIS